MEKLTILLGLGGVNGTMALTSISGLFTLANAPVNAVLFMAGPGALINASLLDGNLKERIFSAVIAGIIATLLVALSAGFGPRFLKLFNINVLKIFGGISIIFIALLIMGLKIPENSPLWIMLIGLAAGVFWR